MTASIIDMEQSTADAPVYTIRTLDYFAKIPPKRLGACLLDFRVAIDTAREVVAALRGMDQSVAWPLSQFQWRDDGERGELRDMVFALPNGERVSLRDLMNKRRTLGEQRPASGAPDEGTT